MHAVVHDLAVHRHDARQVRLKEFLARGGRIGCVLHQLLTDVGYALEQTGGVGLCVFVFD